MQFRNFFELVLFAVFFLSTCTGPAQSSQNDCQFAYIGKDPATQQTRKDVESVRLFSYTPPQLSAYFIETQFLECNAHLTALTGGYRFLNLHFLVNSTQARKSFGGIAKGSVLTIFLTSGKIVRLFNNKQDKGVYDIIRQEYQVKTQYSITKQQEKQLRKSKIKKVRVIWATGFEDYQVAYPSFFETQFGCL